MKPKVIFLLTGLALFAALNAQFSICFAQGTAFAYQGVLQDNGAPASGSYSLRFILYNAEFGGSQVGPTLTNQPVVVAEGLFTTTLDFGATVLDGSQRWLEVAVRTNGSAVVHTALSPRQPLGTAPYAFRAARLTGTLPDSQLSANVPRLNGNSTFTGTVLFDARTGPPFAVGNAEVVAKLNADMLDGFEASDFAQAGHNHDTNYWKLTGNTNANPTNGVFLGTIDNLPLEFRVNNRRAWRAEPGGLTGNSVLNIIGGSSANSISNNSAGCVIAGGGGGGSSPNVIADDTFPVSESAIVGGLANRISDDRAFIGGGLGNLIEGRYSAIAGGLRNYCDGIGRYSFIGGGQTNYIDSEHCFIGGGTNNAIDTFAYFSAIAGGRDHRINFMASNAVISGGWSNVVDTGARLGTIPGGAFNFVDGISGFAAGYRARVLHNGAFVWGDFSETNVSSSAANQFTVRASGGARFFSNTNLTAGVSLAAGGGSWTMISDRHAKENFEPVDAQAVLAKVAALPLSTWNYKSQADDIRHIGPMAQDFKAAFGVGETDTGITTVDANGVALAAIQGLNRKLEEKLQHKEAEITDLKKRLAQLEGVVSRLAGKRSTANEHE